MHMVNLWDVPDFRLRVGLDDETIPDNLKLLRQLVFL
jgi:hypothetical protein